MHSKKIGTVLSVGLIQRFFSRFINPVVLIGLSRMRVKLFFDEADIATALHTRDVNVRKDVDVRVEMHIFIQIVN